MWCELFTFQHGSLYLYCTLKVKSLPETKYKESVGKEAFEHISCSQIKKEPNFCITGPSSM